MKKDDKTTTALEYTKGNTELRDSFTFAIAGLQAQLFDEDDKDELLSGYTDTDVELAQFFGFC